MSDQQENFRKELTRRRVVQVALLYFAVAWTVTEVLSFLFGAIPIFPVWSKTLVAILFVLGFPVAMFLAWRFDIGTDGIKRTESTSTSGRLTIVVSLLLLVAGTAGLLYLIYPQVQEQAARSDDAQFNPPENSIAVMSFLNMGGNPENEYFSQGVPDTIERLHDDPRFETVVAALQADFDSDRDKILKLGDDLPPCVSDTRRRFK